MLVKDNFDIQQIEEIMKYPKPNATGGAYWYPPDSALQWQFTPFSAVSRVLRNLLKRKNLNKLNICVILNVENVKRLLLNGVKAKNIYFVSDCEERTFLAKKWGIKDTNILKLSWVGKRAVLNDKEKYNMKYFDEGIINPDFGKTPELRKVAVEICKKVTMISDTNHFAQKLDRFQNVESYENLGRNVFDVECTTCISRINPDKSNNKLKIIGKDKTITYNDIPKFVPNEYTAEFLWADSVLSKNFSGLNWVGCGELYRQDVIAPKNKSKGIPLIFNVGKETDKDFLNTNSKAPSLLFCDRKQISKATGFGEHKVIISKSTQLGWTGVIKYAGPEYGCGHNCVSIICGSKKEAIDTIKYLKSDKVKRLISVLKSSSKINTKGIFTKIPALKFESQWK